MQAQALLTATQSSWTQQGLTWGRWHCAAGSDGYLYNSTTRQTFMFNVSYQPFDTAEQACKDAGGHLASYSSEAEQAEVRAAQAGRPLPAAQHAPAARRTCCSRPHPSQRASAGRVPLCSCLLQVEAYYSSMGFMFPSFHRFYWLGLNASVWPTDGLTTATFRWHDESPGPDNLTYSHWGL